MSDYQLLSNTSSQAYPHQVHLCSEWKLTIFVTATVGWWWCLIIDFCQILPLRPIPIKDMHWVNYLLSSSLQQSDDGNVWLSTSVKYFLSGLSLSRSYKHWVNYILSSSLQQFDDGHVWLSTSVKYYLSSYLHQGYALSKLLTIFVAATIGWW